MEQKTIKLLRNVIVENNSYDKIEKDDLNNALKVINQFSTNLNKDDALLKIFKDGREFIRFSDDKSVSDKLLEDYGLTSESSLEEINKRKSSILNNINKIINNTKYIDKAHRYENEYIRVSNIFDKIIEYKNSTTLGTSLSAATNDADRAKAARECHDALIRFADFIQSFSKFSVDTKSDYEIQDLAKETSSEEFSYAYDDMSAEDIEQSNTGLNLSTDSVTINKDYFEPVEYYPNTNIRKPRARGRSETYDEYNNFLTEYFNRYSEDVPSELIVDDNANFYDEKCDYIIDCAHDYFNKIKYAFADLRWLFNHAITESAKIEKDLAYYNEGIDRVDDKVSINNIIKEKEEKLKAYKQFIYEYDNKLAVLNSITSEIYGDAYLTGDIHLSINLIENKNEVKASIVPVISIYDDENRRKYVNLSLDDDDDVEEYSIAKNSLVKVEIEKMLDNFVGETILSGNIDLDYEEIKNSNVEIIINDKSFVVPYEYASQTLTNIVNTGLNNFTKADIESPSRTIKTRTRKQDKANKVEPVSEVNNNQQSTVEEQLDKVLKENTIEEQTSAIDNNQTESTALVTTNSTEIVPVEQQIIAQDVQPVVEDVKVDETPINDEVATEVVEDLIDDNDAPDVEPVMDNTPAEGYKWDSRLTDEQILEALSRDIYEPKGDEYEQYLQELGLKDVTEDKEVEDNVVGNEEVNEDVVSIGWDPRLTEDQILDALSRDIYEPKGDEYEQYLQELGLKDVNTNEYVDNEIVDEKNEDLGSIEKPETLIENTDTEEIINSVKDKEDEFNLTEEEINSIMDSIDENTLDDSDEIVENASESQKTDNAEEVFETEPQEVQNAPEEPETPNRTFEPDVTEEDYTEEDFNDLDDNQEETSEDEKVEEQDESEEEQSENQTNENDGFKVTAAHYPRNFKKTMGTAVLGGLTTLFVGPAAAVVAGGVALALNIKNIREGIKKHQLKKIARECNAKLYFLPPESENEEARIEVRSLNGTHLSPEQSELFQAKLDLKYNRKIKDRNEDIYNDNIDRIAKKYDAIVKRVDDEENEGYERIDVLDQDGNHINDETAAKIEAEMKQLYIPEVELDSLENAFIKNKKSDNFFIYTTEDVLDYAPENITNIKDLIRRIYELNPELDGEIKTDNDEYYKEGDGGYFIELENPEDLNLPYGFKYEKGVGIMGTNKATRDLRIGVIKKQKIEKYQEKDSTESSQDEEQDEFGLDDVTKEIIDNIGANLLYPGIADDLINAGYAYTKEQIEYAAMAYKEITEANKGKNR